MTYLVIAGIAWPLFWFGLKHYGYHNIHPGERAAIATVLAAGWPFGIVIMACIDHGERHP